MISTTQSLERHGGGGPLPAPGPRVLRAAVVGHAIEWYEFSISGVLAAYLSTAIFPTGDLATSLMLTWATFAIAFLIRPIGGIVLAHFADRVGRRQVLFTTVLLMTIATTGIAWVPSYATVGLLAPVLFVSLRLIQGFAVGGEMSSAVPYVMESVPLARRARSASLLATGTFGAALFGALIAAALAALLGPGQMGAWGWRVPFLLALPLGVIAMLVRRRAPESTEFRALSETQLHRSPLRVALHTHLRRIIVYAAVALGFNVALAAALSGYLSEILLHGVAPDQALIVSAATYVSLIISILGFAPLSDRIGRRFTLGVGAALAILLIVPELLLGHTGSVALAAIGGGLFAIPAGILATPVYLTLSELFPVTVRSTAGSLGFNTATALSSLVPLSTLALRGIGIDFGLAIWVIVSMTILLWGVTLGWGWANRVER